MSISSKKQILALLAKEWEITGPPGIIDLSDIAAMLPIAPSEIMATVKELFSTGLIDMNTLKTSAFLTPEGYDHVMSQSRVMKKPI